MIKIIILLKLTPITIHLITLPMTTCLTAIHIPRTMSHQFQTFARLAYKKFQMRMKNKRRRDFMSKGWRIYKKEERPLEKLENRRISNKVKPRFNLNHKMSKNPTV